MIVVIKWVCYRSSISSAGCTASSFFQCFSHSLVRASVQRYSVKPWAILSCLNPYSRSGGERGEVRDEVANNVVVLLRWWERDPSARQVARGGRWGDLFHALFHHQHLQVDLKSLSSLFQTLNNWVGRGHWPQYWALFTDFGVCTAHLLPRQEP